ncbi:hypothetical protein V1525DRAFT_408811 [Lipomyces kononenkoae]|uniref:Uncharacterized protein n=1 Tax=Lipomyces kononenkoae TaxID=34357 RepID=A0ACC3SWN1_LIPKO
MHPPARSDLPHLWSSDLPGGSIPRPPSDEDDEEDIIEDIELLDLVNSAKQAAARSNRYPTRSAIMRSPTANALAASAIASYYPTAVTIEPISTRASSSSLKSAFENLVRYLRTSKSKRAKPKELAVPTTNYSQHGKSSYRYCRDSRGFNSATSRLQSWWSEVLGRDTRIHSNTSITRSQPTLNGALHDSASTTLSNPPERDGDANLMADLHSRHLPSQRRNAMDLADPDEERRQFFTSFTISRTRRRGMVRALNAFDDDYMFQSQPRRSGCSQENINQEQVRIQRLRPCLPAELQQCYSGSRRSRRSENAYHTSGPLLSSGFTENLSLEPDLSVPDLAVITNR